MKNNHIYKDNYKINNVIYIYIEVTMTYLYHGQYFDILQSTARKLLWPGGEGFIM